MLLNAEYAGKMFDMNKLPKELQQKYPHGVPFTALGHPDFSRYSIRKVQINVTGNNVIDKRLADKAAGFIGGIKRPNGYIWHHHEDRGRMQLIPEEIHQKTGHLGGDALWGKEEK